MHAEVILQLQDVAAGYPGRLVLEGISCSFARGAFTGLLGPNGSGKTTLLKTIAGILPALAGKVSWSGKVRIGYVPQRDALDPIFLLSSLEVVLMVTRNEKAWALECMRSTGVDELARKRFSELSGGQKQRVLIARALATRADFLMLDEPTAGVDPGAAGTIMELLRKIHQQGLTILMVSHDVALMRRYPQRIVWIHGGKVEEGSASEMLGRERVFQMFELDAR